MSVNNPRALTINKGIPAPTPNHREKPIYPFAQMEVGDSFDAPRDMGRRQGRDARQAVLLSRAYDYTKKHNPKARFTVRLIDDQTVRVWRIA